jgi:surface antigen/LysM repeat protein
MLYPITSYKFGLVQECSISTTSKVIRKFNFPFSQPVVSRHWLRVSKRSKKRNIRYGLLAANFIVLLIVSVFILQGRKAPSGSPNQQASFSVNTQTTINPLDQLSSSDIAVNIAQTSRLAEAQAVRNNADSVNAQLSITSTDQKVVAKPQVIAAGLKSRKDIQKYVVKPGDTVASIASKFGITSDTIKWSNGLTADTVDAGKELLISPVDGVLYKVNQGDTVDALVDKYRSNKDLLVAMNDAEVALPIGQYIVIPGGTPPSTRARAGGLASTGLTGFAFGGFSPVYGSNGYDYGYCTWWAAVRRSQIGRPVPSNLGNASTWKILAQKAGLGVGNAPAAGAVIWTPPRDYYGHVGYVESVNGDGSVNISEMNVAGFAVKSYKTISAAEASRYSYIY